VPDCYLHTCHVAHVVEGCMTALSGEGGCQKVHGVWEGERGSVERSGVGDCLRVSGGGRTGVGDWLRLYP